jgi:serine/threonine/tyrosine-interacting protein
MASLREETALSDTAATHMRNQAAYSHRLPMPPRIVVPPPTHGTETPSLSISGRPNEQIDMGFLRELDLAGIVTQNTLLDWTYERRRHAQMILPWLYLGPMVAAKDKNFLANEGITMALAIRARDHSMTGAIRASREVCAEVATVDVPAFHDLIGRFPEANRLISSHLVRMRQHSLETTGQPSSGKVMVFCESGNEKSAAVVAAYLMDTLDDLDHVKAMQLCQAQRFCVNFDDTVKNILCAYWDLVQARRSVATSSEVPQMNILLAPNAASAQLSTASRQKRRMEDMRNDDDDMDMDIGDGGDASDALRFTGRDVTPFQSRDDA